MMKHIHYGKAALCAFAAIALTSCASVNLNITGREDDYHVVAVTPAVVSELQQELHDKHYVADNGPLVVETPYNYRLGVGDILYAKLYIPSVMGFDGVAVNQQQPSDNWQQYNEVIIKDDGNVSFPYVGELQFANLTLSEAKQALDKALAVYFKKPQSVLEVKEFRSRKVQMTGEFQKPGVQNLRYVPLHVLEAINTAGGLQDTADVANASIIHKDGTAEKIDLFSLLYNGNPAQNRILFDGDTLHIPANYGNRVFVMGEVNKPTLQFIKAGRMTVMEALNNAQGMNYLTASYERIYVIRGVMLSTTQPASNAGAQGKISPLLEFVKRALPSKPAVSLQTKVYQLDGSNGNGLAMAAQFPLQPNDVVYVSSTPISDWNRFITQLLPFNAVSASTSINR